MNTSPKSNKFLLKKVLKFCIENEFRYGIHGNLAKMFLCKIITQDELERLNKVIGTEPLINKVRFLKDLIKKEK